MEDETDFDLLKVWAEVLGHRLAGWFCKRPFWHNNHGRHPREAKGHFFALRAIRSRILGVLLLDGDNRSLPDKEVLTDGLSVRRWQRYEVESYLVHPVVLKRFLERRSVLPLYVDKALTYFRDQVPPAVLRDPIGDHDYLRSTPASKTLLPVFFRAADLQIAKSDYYLIAELMKAEEMAQEVQTMLDSIATAINLE